MDCRKVAQSTLLASVHVQASRFCHVYCRVRVLVTGTTTAHSVEYVMEQIELYGVQWCMIWPNRSVLGFRDYWTIATSHGRFGKIELGEQLLYSRSSSTRVVFPTNSNLQGSGQQ